MLEILLLLIIFVSLIYISIVDNIFFSILINGIISFVFTIFYIVFKAPDIALTEVAIGSSISTLFFSMSLLLIKNQKINKKKIKIIDINQKIIFLFGSILVFYFFSNILTEIPIKKEFDSEFENIGNWYVQNANSTFNIPSIVTSIIVGFRAIDTLFETLLIIVSSFVFLKIMKNKEF